MGLHRTLEHRALVALGGLLRQVADAGAARAHDDAVLGRRLAEDQADERGLAGAVRAHEGAAVAGTDHPVDPVEQHPLADRVAHPLELDHRQPPLRRPLARIPVDRRTQMPE